MVGIIGDDRPEDDRRLTFNVVALSSFDNVNFRSIAVNIIDNDGE